ncbi:MAG: hypothetical protein ACOY94_04160 [Bacillota bacterium]
MLDPRDRRLFFDALRPPEGYELDCAIGTTFSLDLLALLMVPLAFTEFEAAGDESHLRPDPLVLLKAIQNRVDRIHLFCQAGQISLPRHYRGLFSYLEPAVNEVTAPHPDGVFHPKVWALRYTAAQHPVKYRLLVASRNLTVDRSWDTLLALDGELVDRRNAFSRNHPLGDFFAALPGMAVHGVSASCRATVELVQADLRRVAFGVPEGFDPDQLAFWPFGLSRRQSPTNPFGEARVDRLMIISPFLSPSTVGGLARKGGVLVSRAEELAQLSAAVLARFGSVYVLHDAASPEPGAEEDGEKGTETLPLQGLHAKLYVADAGWDARLWTGSANATEAAMGRNVEFLVELAGRKRLCGIDAILGEGSESFAALLQPYTPPAEAAEPDALEQALEAAADKARRLLATAGLQAQVEPSATKGEYGLAIESPVVVPLPPGVEATCWPITLKEEAVAQPAVLGVPGRLAAFGPLSLEALTGFFGFAVTASQSGRRRQVRFVLNLPLNGAPAERPQAILRAMLQNRQQVLRYLMLLLGFSGAALPGETAGGARLLAGVADGAAPGSVPGLPVLEAMVRTLHQNPAQLDQVARLVMELQQTPEGKELLPEGFDEIWEPIWAVRKELKA